MSIPELTRPIKRLILILNDCVFLGLAFLTSVLVLDFLTRISLFAFSSSLAVATFVYLLVASRFKVFSVLTRYTSSKTLVSIGLSLGIAHLVVLLYSYIFLSDFSYRIIFLSLIFSFIYMTTPRICWRALSEHQRYDDKQKGKLRTLVVGAGDGGNLFVSTVLNSISDIDIIGIVDKDPHKKNTYIQGKKILGNKYDIPRLVGELAIDQVTIAIPSLTVTEREEIVSICQDCGVKINSMPNVEDIILGNVTTSSLREIDIADLLGRDEVELDQESLDSYFSGKTILVTGAGGSIGSEICRQVASFCPRRLLLLGHGENSIYLIHKELAGKFGAQMELIPIIADIQDRALMLEVMAKYKPDVVYHAAAHKHVPLMEYNPREAVKNNIFGTKNVAEAAKAAGVSKFVMVSTDKAVNPPNIMGATKRVAEMIVTGLNVDSQTQFVAVRFGNVLGSRGSVVPLFKEQIAQGGPVTVTDFRMTRYFMTIPEASRLVIQAGYLANGGEIFVLDMGEPVLIKDLAKKVIKLSGYTEKEIEIVESGIRPGEKLYEELLSTDERVAQQVHKKIFVGKVTTKPLDEVETFIASLGDKSEDELRQALLDYARQE